LFVADTSTMDTSDRADLEARLRDAERRAFEAEAAYETLLGQAPGAIYAYRDVSDRIAEAIAKPSELPVGRLSVRASIGSAVFPNEAGDARTLLRLADEKMYARKRERTQPDAGIRELA
jgi:GGDEF domain-containing protein